MSRFSLEGRVAVVTGAGSGIGRGCGRPRCPHRARRSSPGASGANGERDRGVRSAVVGPTDVTDVDQCEHLVDGTIVTLGRLEIVVNNAAGASTKQISDWTAKEWHQVIGVNIGSVWFLSRFAAKPMLEQGMGSIVNNSSGPAFFAFPIGAPYGASKTAVNNLGLSMAATWTPNDVRVNAVASGAVAGPKGRGVLCLKDRQPRRIPI